MSKKRYCKDGIKKTILELKTSSLEFPFVPSFILNKALWSFRTKFAPKSYFRDRTWENNCQIRSLQPWRLLCTDFHSKQSTLKFWDKIFLKRVWKRNTENILELKISSLEYPFLSSFKPFQVSGLNLPKKFILWRKLGKYKVLAFYFGPM